LWFSVIAGVGIRYLPAKHLEHDNADGERKLTCPLLVLWGEKGRLAQCFDIVALWRERAANISSEGLPGGH
jgi:haloacetate dehalogenase